MRLGVVDPRLLIRAFEYPRSDPARLLALFAYGRVCINAAGYPHDEADEMAREVDEQGGVLGDEELRSMRAWAARQVDDARRRTELMDEAFEQYPPGDLLLALSSPLLDELTRLAQEAQGRGNVHVQPDRVRRLLVRHAWTALSDLGPAPFYLGAERHSEYEYLIHTGVVADAGYLITDDPVLQLPGDASHRDPRSGRTVRPYSFDDFVRLELPYGFNLRLVDAHAVLHAAVAPLAGSP
jgi:hypothetical protein